MVWGKSMNWKHTAFAIAFVLAQAPAHAQESDEALRAEVNAIFADLMVEGAPGAGVIIAQNGEPLHELYYGEADLVHSVPIGPDTVFHVASVSKQFTAYAINRLALEGKIDLDAPFQTYLPDTPDYGAPISVRLWGDVRSRSSMTLKSSRSCPSRARTPLPIHDQ